MEKPRLSYSEVFAVKRENGFKEGSVSWLIEKFMIDMAKPGSRQLGDSRICTLRRLQRLPIGAKQHEALKPVDFIDQCKELIADPDRPVKPQTVNQYMTAIVGVLKYAAEVLELPDAGLNAYNKTKKRLMKDQLIGKSERRERLPTDEEIAILRAHFAEQNKRPKNEIDMVVVMDAELVTGRRIGELCRIERQHVDVVKRTCMIYNLKNSKGKGFHAEFALIEGAWELFEQRLAVISQHPEARLFPFNSHSCSARYTEAKKDLRKLHPGMFENLRMHDNRAECFVRLLDKGYSSLQVRKGVSLHRNPNTFENVYARIKAVDLHNGPVAAPGSPMRSQ